MSSSLEVFVNTVLLMAELPPDFGSTTKVANHSRLSRSFCNALYCWCFAGCSILSVEAKQLNALLRTRYGRFLMSSAVQVSPVAPFPFSKFLTSSIGLGVSGFGFPMVLAAECATVWVHASFANQMSTDACCCLLLLVCCLLLPVAACCLLLCLVGPPVAVCCCLLPPVAACSA